MSGKIPYEEIMDGIKDDVDYVAKEAYKNGYDDGAKSVKNWDEEEKNLRIKEVYKKGINDMWEATKKLSLMSPEEAGCVFSGAEKYNRYNLGYSGVEALEKIKAYEDEHKIRIGDEVRATYGNAIVTRVTGKTAEFFYKTGEGGCDYLSNIERTGRHFDEIEKLLEKMRE